MTTARHARFFLLRLAAQNVGRRLLRSVFLGLAVMIAVGVGFSGAVLGWALRDGVTTSFSRMGADLVIVPYGALVNITSTLLTVQPTELELDESIGERLRAAPGVAKVAPQRLVRAGVEGRAINLIAYDPGRDFTVEPWLPEKHRASLDARGLFVGERVAEKPGETITICGRTLAVAGRLGHTGVGPVDESYFITFSGLEQLIDAARADHRAHHAAVAECLPNLAPQRFTAYLLQLSSGASLDQARFVIGQIPGVKIVAGNPVFTSARQSLGSLLWGVAAFAGLLVLALLLVVSLLFSAIVQERYREIGVLRALGARSGQIVRITLVEAVLITATGGALGVAFGFSLIFISARSLGFYFASLGVPFAGPPESFIWTAAAAAMFCGVALGVIGAVIASRRALCVEPYRMIQMESAP